jgi:hypothetical protein
MVYRDCVDGLPAHAGPTVRARAGVRWINPVVDLAAFGEYRAAGEVTPAQWARQLLTAQVNEGFNWRDPLPGLVAVGQRVQRRFKKLIGRR